MSLYLKYRPKTIDELDLAEVRKSLNSLISSNTVAHAYLFTGPRGAGKTSSARILARVVNCEHNDKKLAEPCNKCAACLSIFSSRSLDFVEIDAASNRGIDDIRELKEKIRLAPSELKYKVYIIDEVHMLTSEAFNALLKTLEEPPAHAIFILCTTETHKVPETIISRCVRVQFGKANLEEMKRSFARVIAGEGKQVDPEALDYLARNVDGSFRDGVKILDTVLANHDVVTLSIMEESIAGTSGFDVSLITQSLIAKDTQQALEGLHAAINQGVDATYLTVSLMKALRDELLAGADRELVKLVFALDDVARKIATSPVPTLLIEMVIIEWCSSSTSKPVEPSPRKSEKNDKEKVVKQVENSVGHNEVWQKLMSSLSGDNITLGALLSKAHPAHLAGELLTISVDYAFHREQIMSDKVLRKLEDALEQAVGRRLRVVCEIGTSKQSHPVMSNQGSDKGDTIDEAMAIFHQ